MFWHDRGKRKFQQRKVLFWTWDWGGRWREIRFFMPLYYWYCIHCNRSNLWHTGHQLNNTFSSCSFFSGWVRHLDCKRSVPVPQPLLLSLGIKLLPSILQPLHSQLRWESCLTSYSVAMPMPCQKHRVLSEMVGIKKSSTSSCRDLARTGNETCCGPSQPIQPMLARKKWTLNDERSVVLNRPLINVIWHCKFLLEHSWWSSKYIALTSLLSWHSTKSAFVSPCTLKQTTTYVVVVDSFRAQQPFLWCP